MPYLGGANVDADEWTPKRGWTIMAKRGGLRMAILLTVEFMAMWILWRPLQMIPQHGMLLAISFSFSGAVSFLGGYLVARKLGEITGLAGRALLLPVLIPLGGFPFLAYKIVSFAHGEEGGMLIWAFAIGLIIWGVLMAFRTLVLQ